MPNQAGREGMKRTERAIAAFLLAVAVAGGALIPRFFSGRNARSASRLVRVPAESSFTRHQSRGCRASRLTHAQRPHRAKWLRQQRGSRRSRH